MRKNTLLKALLLLMMVGGSFNALMAAQVKGIVKDGNGAPIAGALIVQKGQTSIAANSASDGTFSINVTDNAKAVLTVSFLSYETQNVPVDNQAFLSVSLQESSVGLNEIVFIGYGTVKRRD